jgi:hypothetical protein
LKYQIYGIVIIINALIIVLELPITLYFLYNGTLYSDGICTSWITFNHSLFLLTTAMIAWTSIERYLFIHHEQIIMHHTMLLHYIPIICIALYSPLFYIGVVVLYPCKPTYELELYLCGGACYEFESILGTIDWLGNDICMVIITLIVNVILIVCHLIQRFQTQGVIIAARRRFQWVNILDVFFNFNDRYPAFVLYYSVVQ